ncbi:MAG: hypothetical protein LBR27_10160 [Bifidobacteriaceae bacterium]|jgi:energy-coupling factor transporter ATP-binding protein EcfA2|nr:hypothetical protein [Bifidobacteriaceae bacterium]
MHFTLACRRHPAGHDAWAEDGTPWHQVLADLSTTPAACALSPATGAATWYAGDHLLAPDDAAGTGHLPHGCLVSPEPRPEPRFEVGAWRLVRLGSPQAGAELPLRGAGLPNLTAGRTARGRVRLRATAKRRDSQVIWLGRIRWRGLAKTPKVRWRRLGRRPRWGGRGSLIRRGGATYVLTKTLPEAKTKAAKTARLAKAGGLGAGAVTSVVAGVVMVTMTRNPMWAAMPAAALAAMALPLLRRGQRHPWCEDVIGLGDVATTPPKPGTLPGDPPPGLTLAALLEARQVTGTGPASAVHAVLRSLALAHLAKVEAGPRTVTAPKEPDWAWTRFLAGQDGLELTCGCPRDEPCGLAVPAPEDGRETTLDLAVRPAGLGLVVVRHAHLGAALMAPLGSQEAERRARLAAAGGQAQTPVRLPVEATPNQIEATWRQDCAKVLVGTAEAGRPVTLDLPKQGPHLLVAGATGSGKSEFLRTLMLSAALSMGPDRLAIVGIDHKGGATFHDLAALPHVAGVVTDLDTAASARALTSLAAELTARERLLEAHGVAKLAELPPAVRPPRLMVVVDEFRTLLDTVPDAAPALERLAAQGRSLDMFLVLATQRPSGAVSAQLRANLPLRICFRVATETDSLDVIGSTAAAAISPEAPGTGLVATSGRPTFQMRALLATTAPRRPAGAMAWPQAWAAPEAAPPSGVEATVERLAATAAHLGLGRPAAPWAPALPDRLDLADLAGQPAAIGPQDPAVPSLPVALADLPETQHQGVLNVAPADGHLVVAGPPRLGRTTAAVTVAAAALARGWEVHVLTASPGAFEPLRAAPTLGSVVPVADLDLVAAALAGLAQEPPLGAPPRVLVIDGADALAEVPLDRSGGMAMDALAGGHLTPGTWLVATAGQRLGRWAAQFPQRLILPMSDQGADLMLGVPKHLAGLRQGPGRCCYQRPGLAVLAQLAMAGNGLTFGPVAATLSAVPPPRVLPLPKSVHQADLPPATKDMLWWGLGGPLGTPVGLPLQPGVPVAIVGPPGSGRTAALTGLAGQAGRAGLPTANISPTGSNAWEAIVSALDKGAIVLADNLDQLPGPVPPALPATGTLIGALTTAAAGSFRAPATLFHQRPNGLVLWPATPGSNTVFGSPINLPGAGAGRAATPPPGRGVAVAGASLVPVQCARG